MAKGYHSYVITILLPVAIPVSSAVDHSQNVMNRMEKAYGDCLFVSRYSFFGIGYHFTEISTVSAIILIRRHSRKELVRVVQNARDDSITPSGSVRGQVEHWKMRNDLPLSKLSQRPSP